MKKTESLLFRTFGIMLVLFTVFVASTAVLAADSYPSKPVRLIVPAGAGGGMDIIARLIATKLSERLGMQVIVENQGGGGGVIGTEKVARANPDGYTLLLANPTRTIQPALEKLPYDLVKSFTPIALVGSGAHVLVVHESVPAKSVKEFIELAKQKPGQLTFASSGVGSIVHLEIELFKILAGIDFKIVQFKGTGPAVIDVIGGHSQASIGSTAGYLVHIKSGKVRALGSTGLERSETLPDVPTIAEAGVPGYQAISWFGILAPTGTPGPVVDRLNKELRTILALDEMKKVFQDDGLTAAYLGPAQFGAMLEREIAQWGNLIKKANIRLEK